MRVLVTGAAGLLGIEMVSALEARGIEVVATTRKELDVAEPESVAQIAAETFGHLDWCVNCAAYTAVDKAEEEEQLATDVNGFGPGYLSSACGMIGLRLLHISTDFVFDGTATTPYTEEDATNPLGAYGRSKLLGERGVQGNFRAVTVRTSWLFGPRGNCFPKSILRALDAGKSLRVVADQIGTPTYTPYLAQTLTELIQKDPFPGIYHAAGFDIVSWHAFASLVVEKCRGHAEIEPINTAEWPTAAKRPAYSALSSEKLFRLGIPPMPPLEEAVEDFCKATANILE